MNLKTIGTDKLINHYLDALQMKETIGSEVAGCAKAGYYTQLKAAQRRSLTNANAIYNMEGALGQRGIFTRKQHPMVGKTLPMTRDDDAAGTAKIEAAVMKEGEVFLWVRHRGELLRFHNSTGIESAPRWVAMGNWQCHYELQEAE